MRRARANRPRRLDVFQLADTQHLTPHETRVADPPDDRQREQDVPQTGPQHRHERDGEQQSGKRQEDVDQATDDVVEHSAKVPGGGAQQGSDRR